MIETVFVKIAIDVFGRSMNNVNVLLLAELLFKLLAEILVLVDEDQRRSLLTTLDKFLRE